MQRAVEQTLNIPVPGRGGGGGRGGLQGSRPGQISTARSAEQIVDIPVPSGGLHDLPDPGGSSSSAVPRDERGDGFFQTFPWVKKSPIAARPSPRVPARSSSWTPVAYAGGQAGDYDVHDEYFEYGSVLWKQAWDCEDQCHPSSGFCFSPV